MSKNENNEGGIIETKHDPFWFNHWRILFNSNRLIEFYPTKDMSFNEKLNAMTRLFLYSGILMFLYKGKSWPIYLIVGGLFITLFMFKFQKKQENKDIQVTPKKVADDYEPGYDISEINPDATTDPGLQYEQCTAPTKNNPFMNPSVNEQLDNPTRPQACDYTDPSVYKELEDHFNHNLYKDIDDLFGKNNSQRQFYTTPSTTYPNDQSGFARWLYNTPATCKEDQSSCLRYEDLRSNRKPVGDWDTDPANLYGY